MLWLTAATAFLGGLAPTGADAQQPGFRETLADALTLVRLRDGGLLAMREAYRGMESSLLQDHPELAAVAVFYQGLVAVELGEFDAAREAFDRCHGMACTNPDLPRLASIWSRALKAGEIPDDSPAGPSSQLQRIRLVVGGAAAATSPAEAPVDLDSLYVALLSGTDGAADPEGLIPLTPAERLNFPDPEGRTELDVIYEVYDPAWFTVGLLRRLQALRSDVQITAWESAIREPWFQILSPLPDAAALEKLAQAPLDVGPEAPMGQKEFMALQYVAAEKTNGEERAAALLADLQGSGIDTGDVWTLRGMSLAKSGAVGLMPQIASAIRGETAGDPFSPRWCRPLRKSDLARVSARVGCYQEFGWAFRARMLNEQGFDLKLPASLDALRADEVLRAVAAIAGRGDEFPRLSAVTRWECQLRIGDWEMFQNEVDAQFLARYPETAILLNLARFVSGRLRTGDGTPRTAALPAKEAERHAETAIDLLSGAAGLETGAPRELAERHRQVRPNPAGLPQRGGEWKWFAVPAVLGLAAAAWAWHRSRRRNSERGTDHVG